MNKYKKLRMINEKIDQHWQDLVLWDSITICYSVSCILDIRKLKDIGAYLTNILVNDLYNVYIKKNKIRMNPQFYLKENVVYYTVSSHPRMLPSTFPEDMYQSFPQFFTLDGLTFNKISYHAL